MTIAPTITTSAAEGLLASLDAEQRAAATLPDGPAQIIAPAGSGKTTTLIYSLAVILGRGWTPSESGTALSILPRGRLARNAARWR
jgi:DNA helicase-2/ATP-dependent DNA helicase PcrA